MPLDIEDAKTIGQQLLMLALFDRISYTLQSSTDDYFAYFLPANSLFAVSYAVFYYINYRMSTTSQDLSPQRFNGCSSLYFVGLFF